MSQQNNEYSQTCNVIARSSQTMVHNETSHHITKADCKTHKSTHTIRVTSLSRKITKLYLIKETKTNQDCFL